MVSLYFYYKLHFFQEVYSLNLFKGREPQLCALQDLHISVFKCFKSKMSILPEFEIFRKTNSNFGIFELANNLADNSVLESIHEKLLDFN